MPTDRHIVPEQAPDHPLQPGERRLGLLESDQPRSTKTPDPVTDRVWLITVVIVAVTCIVVAGMILAGYVRRVEADERNATADAVEAVAEFCEYSMGMTDAECVDQFADVTRAP